MKGFESCENTVELAIVKTSKQSFAPQSNHVIQA